MGFELIGLQDITGQKDASFVVALRSSVRSKYTIRSWTCERGMMHIASHHITSIASHRIAKQSKSERESRVNRTEREHGMYGMVLLLLVEGKK